MPRTAGNLKERGDLLQDFQDFLEDGADPVAVFLLKPGQEDGALAGFKPVRGHRYCQALMKARHGESVLLEPDGLSCPAAAAAFGFRPLPAQLANGKGLVGFGIVAQAAAGARMFAHMPGLAGGSIAAIALCPLRVAPHVPDVVVVEGPSEVLMWLLLADLNAHGGQRRTGSTAVLQATCVDALPGRWLPVPRLTLLDARERVTAVPSRKRPKLATRSCNLPHSAAGRSAICTTPLPAQDLFSGPCELAEAVHSRLVMKAAIPQWWNRAHGGPSVGRPSGRVRVSDWMERKGRKNSPDWHLANGLLRLAQGLKQDHDAQEERLKSFARSVLPSELESDYEVHLT